MSTYKRKDRGGQWWFRTKDATGKRVNRPGGATKREAVEAREAFRREQEALRGEVRCELKDFIVNTYLPEQASNVCDRSLERELGAITSHLLPFFIGECRCVHLKDVTPELITQYKNQRAEKVSSGTVRRELAILRHVFSMAVMLDKIDKSPFLKVKMPRDSVPRVRFLDPSEWESLLKNVPENYKAIAVFLVNTGCRRGDALSLRWSNVDLVNGFGVIEEDKRHKEKIITLNSDVIALLKTLPRHATNDRVFFWIPSGAALSMAFGDAVKKTGVVNFRLHDLRHTAASHLAMAGHDIKTIQDFLGHSDIRQTTRYAHLTRQSLRNASDSLAGKFSGETK
jgi:integrase